MWTLSIVERNRSSVEQYEKMVGSQTSGNCARTVCLISSLPRLWCGCLGRREHLFVCFLVLWLDAKTSNTRVNTLPLSYLSSLWQALGYLFLCWHRSCALIRRRFSRQMWFHSYHLVSLAAARPLRLLSVEILFPQAPTKSLLPNTAFN